MKSTLELLERREAVRVSELAEHFSVSEVTVRSDLTELARRGLVARVRGGARALALGQSELAVDIRMRLEAPEKLAIAKAAAAMVGDGEAIALDSSTTAYYLALELHGKRELVVVTNGLLIAAALAEAPGISVVLTGGMLRRASMSVVGDLAGDVLRTTRIDKGFFGARGLSLAHGLMDLNPDEVRRKRELAAACDQVIGIFDRTKWQRPGLLAFVPTERVAAIVTDAGAPEDVVGAWRDRGVTVVVAEPDGRRDPRERLPGLRRAVAARRGAA